MPGFACVGQRCVSTQVVGAWLQVLYSVSHLGSPKLYLSECCLVKICLDPQWLILLVLCLPSYSDTKELVTVYRWLIIFCLLLILSVETAISGCCI